MKPHLYQNFLFEQQKKILKVGVNHFYFVNTMLDLIPVLFSIFKIKS